MVTLLRRAINLIYVPGETKDTYVDPSRKYLASAMKRSPSDLNLTMVTLDTSNLTNIMNETLNDGDLEAHEEEDYENNAIW